MKIRNGFVSNSSSSSFVCNICGQSYEGWDASPRDPEFECSECEHGHVMCNEHLLGDPEVQMVEGCECKIKREPYDADVEKFCPECGEPTWLEGDGYISPKQCPICQFKEYDEETMSQYLEKTRGVSRDTVFAEVKAVNKRRKKLYESEYINYVCKKFSLTDDMVLEEIKTKFDSNYDKYMEFLNGD